MQDLMLNLFDLLSECDTFEVRHKALNNLSLIRLTLQLSKHLFQTLSTTDDLFSTVPLSQRTQHE